MSQTGSLAYICAQMTLALFNIVHVVMNLIMVSILLSLLYVTIGTKFGLAISLFLFTFILFLLVNCCGCLGAISRSNVMLTFYFWFTSLFLVLETIFIISTIVFASSIKEYIEELRKNETNVTTTKPGDKEPEPSPPYDLYLFTLGSEVICLALAWLLIKLNPEKCQSHMQPMVYYKSYEKY